MKNSKVIVLTTAILAIVIIGAGCNSGSAYKDGTYEGISTAGMGGEVNVEVKVTDGKIADVSITSHKETEGIGTIAIEKLPSTIIEAQSTEVDDVSGATKTSTAIKEGVNLALEQAK